MLYHSKTDLEVTNLKFDDGVEGRFTGYASVWGRVDSYGDTVVKGAFERTMEDRKRMPLMLYQHDSSQVIGKWLNFEEDDYGFRAEGELTRDHSIADDVRASMRHGAIDGLSIGFRMFDDGSEKNEDGGRILKDIDLVEVSVVSMPAETEARIFEVREEIEMIESIRDIEAFARRAGFSRNDAKRLVSSFRSVYQREADDELNKKAKAKVREADLLMSKFELSEIIKSVTKGK
jgi:HK97 family phage prohead protease